MRNEKYRIKSWWDQLHVPETAVGKVLLQRYTTLIVEFGEEGSHGGTRLGGTEYMGNEYLDVAMPPI